MLTVDIYDFWSYKWSSVSSLCLSILANDFYTGKKNVVLFGDVVEYVIKQN